MKTSRCDREAAPDFATQPPEGSPARCSQERSDARRLELSGQTGWCAFLRNTADLGKKRVLLERMPRTWSLVRFGNLGPGYQPIMHCTRPTVQGASPLSEKLPVGASMSEIRHMSTAFPVVPLAGTAVDWKWLQLQSQRFWNTVVAGDVRGQL